MLKELFWTFLIFQDFFGEIFFGQGFRCPFFLRPEKSWKKNKNFIVTKKYKKK